MGLPVLLVDLHFLGQLLFGHFAEVVVLLNGFLNDLTLVFPLLCQVFEELGFLALKRKEKGLESIILTFIVALLVHLKQHS